MEITRITEKYVEITLTATLADGTPANSTNVSVALLSPRGHPTADTIWLAATVVNNVAKFMLCGFEAPQAGALVAPLGRSDLWARSTDAPEVELAFIEAVHVR